MERSKLKLTVIFLLAVLNICLLGIVFVQNRQSHAYEEITYRQATVYLKKNGIDVEPEIIPWDSIFLSQSPGDTAMIMEPENLPKEGFPENCDIQVMREPATLLVDFVQGLSKLEKTCHEITSITEGYHYSGEGARAVLTPMWKIDTDAGVFLLDCGSGELSLYSGS
ncbi:MAG: hypothetical protein SOR61_01100 [Evtepia sp.]|uniref:hypothetical protein n=1 Tax=Evtepia sp. TaxID=2773933 RepID=UPI002A7509C5|nr:hypothetical protein [Evtepia sp.]MDY3013796.1 hypothetical protein [Evtepia sp.]